MIMVLYIIFLPVNRIYKLKTIHHQGLKLTLGAFWISPIEEAETRTKMISLCLKKISRISLPDNASIETTEVLLT